MAWSVDTSVLVDICAGDPTFGMASALCLEAHADGGLVVSPVVYVELAPVFGGDSQMQDSFLSEVGVVSMLAWSPQDTREAHKLWNGYVQKKRRNGTGKRPMADHLIGAFAKRYDGIITRNPKDFPDVPVICPAV